MRGGIPDGRLGAMRADRAKADAGLAGKSMRRDDRVEEGSAAEAEKGRGGKKG